MNPGDLTNFQKLFCLFLLAAAFILTPIFLAAEVRLVRVPVQRDYGEGHVLWQTREILDPTQAYKRADTLPYVVYPYTPLYMLAARVANHLVWSDPLIAGRSLSLLSTLGIGVALAWTVAFSAPPRAAWLVRAASGAFAGVLPFLMDGVQGWGSLMRVDMLALLLMYAGLGVYITLGERERWQYVAAILFVLALFTKQTMLSAPLACLGFGVFVDWPPVSHCSGTVCRHDQNNCAGPHSTALQMVGRIIAPAEDVAHLCSRSETTFSDDR